MFRKPEGGPVLFGDILNNDTGPLKEIVFNATDFRTGLAFRFQKTSTGVIGNNKGQVNPKDAASIRVGDIVAASSCFPGGFEPIEFPGDFRWINGHPRELKFSSPLMDGGVYDNEGIESILLSEERAGPLDMILMSDTDRQEGALFEMPDSVEAVANRPASQTHLMWKAILRWNPTLGTLAWMSWLLLLLCWLSAGALGLNLLRSLNNLQGTTLTSAVLTTVLPLLLTTVTAGLLTFLRSTFKNKLLSQVPQLQLASWKYLSRIRLASAVDMCWLRVSSLMALTSNIFMKRIRNSGYQSIYEDPAHQGRLVSNFIYFIRTASSPTHPKPQPPEMQSGTGDVKPMAAKMVIPVPGERLGAIAESAAAVPNLLWFQNDQELPNLVATGQATTCLSLMRFLVQTRSLDAQGENFVDQDVQGLWSQLRQDWDQFQINPFFLAHGR